MKKNSFRSLLPLLLLSLALPSACARTPHEAKRDAGTPSAATVKPHPQKKSKSADNGAEIVSANTTLQELERRLLRFIDGLTVPSDLDYPRLESALGIKLGPPSDPAYPWREVKDVALADGYALYATHRPTNDGFSRIEVAVTLPDHSNPTRVPTSTCIWRAEALSKALEGMGYIRGGQRPFQGGWLRQHWRAINGGNQIFSVSLLLYRASDQRGRQDCVYSVKIDGGKP
ncbi:hypothetical protein XAP3CFBP6996_000665 [Xanthomonas citri pv. fuscans CFBP 6996]|uniref:hypothetical protein n=1 Tax=Xanthomonas citri TaxID=346 RepID=UPI000C1801B6|nr:hypothetical protein [Xanthomonas citri]ATS49952.1 hypothetical protein XcfCFBP6992P_02755 [Xanthomonas citri pv. phaseoli var. fuscans]ATS55685.1 hypothetical protein XcfCFBP6994P_11480 [Xanthomonas citri pv. phaseoli var. fuscans]ATS60300.1 hypothetical protein XcfCFBP6996P_14260 [Xanthomonas citri pv. phaseoli var. fuscans]PTY30632.1 hypothetical protein XAP3CFBP6996_000665 [Xanthomonas citri pv. fuscans CFBP 6996]QWN14570.1 hypothetical protein DGN02_00680 [Xanthomonas citri]